MADRKALCLVSGELAEIGTSDRLILPGDPAFNLHAVPKQYVDRRFSHDLTTGEEVYPRELLTSGAVSSTTGNLRLVYFTALKAQATTQVRVMGGSTAAAATPTVIENGLFEINAAGDGARVAVTANDTSLYSVANGTYTRLWLASYNMVVGQRYALSWLVVSTVVTPTYAGYNLSSSVDVEAGVSPRLTGRISGVTTTPMSFTAGSVASTFTRPYGVILP